MIEEQILRKNLQQNKSSIVRQGLVMICLTKKNGMVYILFCFFLVKFIHVN